MRKSVLLLLSSILILFSCSKEEEIIVPEIAYDYAGLVVGKFVIYDVDSITHDDFNSTIDTVSYQIREVVDSKFTDLEGEEAFKIIRYRRDSDTLNWNLIDVWNSKITATNFQKTEENIKYVKLIFPVKEDGTWDGNSMNNGGEVTYEFTIVDQAETIGANSLESVLTVVQFDSPDKLIHPQLFEEKYARGIGMVYKKSLDLIRGNLSAPFNGYDVTMTLSSYGN
ncbi:MAG: hypothetical protein HRT73_14590 [Flavobacteriales bacterium]|nr:hypothetical protein [Flavobacteriales bacterium]